MKLDSLYVLDGREVVRCPDVMAWALWCAANTRSVAVTNLRDGSQVSTTFLGVDMWHGPDCPTPKKPHAVFETMLFPVEGSGQVLDRYATWAEAEVGHMEWVEHLTAAGDSEGSLLVPPRRPA